MAEFLSSPVISFLLVTIALATAATIPSKIGSVSPGEEAEQIALDATSALVADQKLIDQIKKDIKIIRSENPKVSKTINIGRKVVGKVKFESHGNNAAVALSKINASKFGPATSVAEGPNSTIISFPKRYNPDVLTKELKKIGVTNVQGIWLVKDKDHGNIKYDAEKKTYTFREGLENCKPQCKDNHSWIFTVKDGKSKLVGERATDIPKSCQ